MKKRILSLALALALCLGLVTPAIADDTSGLDATSAKAFYNALSAYGRSTIIAYADLKDMDGDGVPELIAVDRDGTVNIWQAKNGSAVQVANEPNSPGNECYMRYYTKDGKVYIAVYNYFRFGDGAEFSYIFITIGGFQGGFGCSSGPNEEEFTCTVNGKTSTITREQYDQYSSACSVEKPFLGGVGSSWNWDGSDKNQNDYSYRDVLNQLNVKADTTATPAPAAGTYGPYMITGTTYDGTAYTISFSAAKVEQKTVQIREYYDIEGGYSAYQGETITLVTIKPDTSVTVSDGYNGEVPVSIGKSDGNDKYTQVVMGAVESLHTSTGKGIFDNIVEGQNYIRIMDYFIVVDADAAPAGFTDVKAGAYYGEAVKWAVDQEITAGTSATTFSPDQTCTAAQILTFLWRANGSPEPTGRNPFSDISSGDYYYKAAIWAYGRGLVSGNKFNPNTPCTRAMTVTYLWKLAGSPSMDVSDGYGPQTITGVYDTGLFDTGVYDEATCSIEFSAAVVEDVTITKLLYGTYDESPVQEREKVTLITVAPGSTMTVKGIPYIWTLEYHRSDGVYLDAGPRGYTDIPSAEFKSDAFEEISYIANAWKIMGFDGESGNPYMIDIGVNTASFTDVSANADYAQAVAWAVEQGITSGTSATTFSPDATCTRGQIVTFLYRAMGK